MIEAVAGGSEVDHEVRGRVHPQADEQLVVARRLEPRVVLRRHSQAQGSPRRPGPCLPSDSASVDRRPRWRAESKGSVAHTGAARPRIWASRRNGCAPARAAHRFARRLPRCAPRGGTAEATSLWNRASGRFGEHSASALPSLGASATSGRGLGPVKGGREKKKSPCLPARGFR